MNPDPNLIAPYVEFGFDRSSGVGLYWISGCNIVQMAKSGLRFVQSHYRKFNITLPDTPMGIQVRLWICILMFQMLPMIR
jgi:hypothetical protein